MDALPAAMSALRGSAFPVIPANAGIQGPPSGILRISSVLLTPLRGTSYLLIDN
jgi:hypothetical protein